MAELLEIEVYTEDQDEINGEYDIMVNNSEYDAIECVTVVGIAEAKKQANKFKRKYRLPIVYKNN